METKNLNESGVISTLQDSEYILVTMADGSVGRIKKSDFYGIVSDNANGLYSSNLYKNSLHSRQTITPESSIVNLNLILTPGVYRIDTFAKLSNNYPIEGNFCGSLVVFPSSVGNQSIHLLVRHTGQSWIRHYWGGFEVWKQVAL